MGKLSKLMKSKDALIMGILNFTPDSFSDGGDYFDEKLAQEQVKKMIEDGADIIDIGCESTRPNATKLSVEEEILRLKKILPQLINNFPDVIFSIDTYKKEVAEYALSLGVDIINDVYGAKNNDMAYVAKKYNAPIIVMHNASCEKNNEINKVIADLKESVNICLNAGVKKENIIVDVGIGFSKEAQENIILTQKLEKLSSLGCAILYGVSRKRTTDYILGGGTNPKDRDVVSVIMSLKAICKGAKIVRVHNVKMMYETLKTHKILEKNN